MICKSFAECFCIDLRRNDPSITFWRSFKMSFSEGRVLAVVMMRVSQYLSQKRCLWRVAPFVKRFNEILTGFECHLSAEVGEGLFIAHTQNLVIGAGVRIGRNVTLYNGVTLGAAARGAEVNGVRYPSICDEVIIYTGAKVLGPINVGPRAIVGANSVVLKMVPADSVAVGVPSKVLKCQNSVPFNQAP